MQEVIAKINEYYSIFKEMKKIIISQLKNIGDVVLLLPMLGILREHFPHVRLVLLGLRYTQALAKCLPYLDDYIDWTALAEQSDAAIIECLAAEQADALIHVAVHQRLAKLAYAAGIPCRIGTGQRWFHWRYCSDWVNQARRHSRLHEAQLNVQLLAPLGIERDDDVADLLTYVHMRVPHVDRRVLETDPKRFNLIVHAGSHGHGRQWPLESFVELSRTLPVDRFKVFLTGSAKEADAFGDRLFAACPHAVNVMGHFDLRTFISAIAESDGVVASGTGPLHMAAALGVYTLGLFPPRKGINPRRWKPLGAQAQYLKYARPKWQCCLTCQESVGCACMKKITVNEVQAVLQSWWQAQHASAVMASS